MPQSYHVTLSDGRAFNVTTEGGAPSEADILASLGHGPTAIDPSEPDTFMGGALKSLKETGKSVAHAALDALPGVGAIVGGALSTSETLGAGTIPGMALGAGVGRGARDLIGHATGLDAPTTPSQKAGHIAADTALTAGTAAVLPGVVEAAKAPGQALREGADQFGSAMPPMIRRLGRLIPSAPTGAPPAILERPPWQTWPAEPPPTVGRLQMTPPAAPPISEADRALTARRYPGIPMDKVEQAAQQQTGSLRMAPSADPHPLTAPRVNVGAEVVGRQQGLSKQAVRDVTGPIRGEAPGAAAGMPNRPMDRIIQKLIDMGPRGSGGPESAREAYAAAGTSDKTRLQVQAYLDVLRKLGYAVPLAAAPSVRDAVLSKLNGEP